MPCATTRRQDASFVQLSGDSAHAGEPLGSQVIYDGPQVRRTVLRVRPDCHNGLLVADLLAPECPCAVGISKLHTACLGSGQSGLGALADQARFQFGYRGHLREQEASHGSWWDVGQVAEHKVDIARHE
jgi:hypothetical protein